MSQSSSTNDKAALLASDMDGTVIPLDYGPKRALDIDLFRQVLAANPQISLAYVTGRHLKLGLEGVAKYRLPRPDIFVCDVGTTIHWRENSNWRLDQEYRARLRHSWHDRSANDIAGLLAGLPGLVAQEAERQSEFKQSYYAGLEVDRKRIVTRIAEELATREIGANVIYSVDTVKGVGLVDVLPPAAAKDFALHYLQQLLAVEHDRLVYAGDSGNDLQAFLSGFQAVVVGNTATEVKEEVRREIGRRGLEKQVFFANGEDVLGVMEGLRHFGLVDVAPAAGG